MAADPLQEESLYADQAGRDVGAAQPAPEPDAPTPQPVQPVPTTVAPPDWQPANNAKPVRLGTPAAAPADDGAQQPWWRNKDAAAAPAAWEPADGAKPVRLAQPAKPMEDAGLWATMGASAWKSTMEMGSDALSGASFAVRQIGDHPATIQWLEDQRHAVDDHIQKYVDSLPANEQAALQASIMGGKDANGDPLPTPASAGRLPYAAAAVGSAIPSAAAAVAAGLAGAGLSVAALALLPEELAGSLTVALGMRAAATAATTGATFGEIQAGEAYKGIVDTLDKATDKQMMQNPLYAHMRTDQGMSMEDAKSTLAQKAAPLVAAQFGVGAAVGAGVGGMAARGILGAAGKGLLARAGIGAGEAGATMGLQGAAGEYLNQKAAIQDGPQQSYDPTKIAQAAASNALAGGLMGAGASLLHGGAGKPAPAETTVSPDASAALKEALPETVAPTGPAPPAFVPPGTNPTPAFVPPGTTRPAPAEQTPPPVSPTRPAFVPPGAVRPGSPTTEAPAFVPPISEPQAAPPTTGATTPEPAADIAAQLSAMADPANPKDAVYIAKGTPMPGNLPTGTRVIVRRQGTLLTTNADKAKAFARGPIDDAKMATILDYPQTKADAIASGNPQVVQGKDAQGNVVHESVVSPDMVPAAQQVAAAHAPDGTVEVNTPQAVLERRAASGPETQTPQGVDGSEPFVLPESMRPVPQEAAAPVLTPAQARRAAAKARMNPTPVEAKPAAYVAEGDAQDVGSQTPDAMRADAIAKLPEASKIVTVKKGADVRPIMNKIIADLTDRIGKTDGTPGAIGETLADWMKGAPKGPIPGTTTGYRQIGEHLVQLLTGHPIERPDIRAEALAETRRTGRDSRVADVEDQLAQSAGDFSHDEAQAQLDAVKADYASREAAADNEAGAPGDAAKSSSAEDGATVAEPAEDGESSAGMTQDFGAEKPRSAQTTNLSRGLRDLESKIANGVMSATDADKLYGKHEGKTAPENRTLADWLRHRIAHATDPENEKALVNKALELHGNKTLTADQKKQITIQIKAEIARHDPDYVERLRDALHEIENPKPPDVTAPPSFARKDTTAGQYERDSRDPAVNAAVDTLLRGEPSSIRNYLDAVMMDPAIRQKLAPLAALARNMRGKVPDIKVYTSEQAKARFGDNYAIDGNSGVYFPPSQGREGFIVLDPKMPMSRVEIVLHEALHSVTAEYLQGLPANHPDRLLMNYIRDELGEALARDDLSATDLEELSYALSDQHELHTMLKTSPTVQRIAAEHIPSSQFRLRMARLGYDASPSKSIWHQFTELVRRALGMTHDPSGRDATLLDHVMRPLQDITDRADTFNRTVGGADYELWHAMPDFSKLKDEVLDKKTYAGLPDTVRKAVLPFAPSDSIVDWNQKLFQDGDKNTLKDLRAATEASAARTAEHHAQYGDQVRDLVSAVKGPERDTLAALLVDTTLADAKIGNSLPADANAHLKDLTEQKTLQARYDAMTPKGQKTYDAIRDYFKETYRLQRDAELRSMIKQALPDATKPQIDRIAEAARTKKGIDTLIAGSDTDPVAKAFGDAWNSRRAIVKGIAKVHRSGFVQGDYFPLRRFGAYIVRYGTKGDADYGVERFERASQAEARRDELLKQNTPGLSGVLDMRASKLRDVLPTTVVDEISAAMEKAPGLAEHAGAMRDLVASIQLQHASRSETARSRMRRQGVKGASTQVERIISRDFLSTASRMGFLEHGVDRMHAIAGMQRHADYLGRTGDDQRRAQQVLNEMQSRMPSGDDASGFITGAARKMSSLGFIHSLMSFSHLVTSTAEAHANSIPLLGARHGPVAPLVALGKAFKDVAPPMVAAGTRNTFNALGKGLKAADWNMASVVRDRLIAGGADKAAMTDLFGRLTGAGLIDHTMAREMQRIAKGTSGDLSQTWWDKFMDFNAAGSHAVDAMNKGVIAKAAYDLELRKGGNHNQAAEYAVSVARKAMPNYNIGNKARIGTDKGPFKAMGAPLMQFKNYGFHMYGVMANLVRESIHGASSADRKEAGIAFAGILATHALMAGSLTLLPDPVKWAVGLYDWAMGADKPRDLETSTRRWLAAVAGPEMAEVLSRGPLYAAGTDIHRRVGLANLLEMPEIKSFDKDGFTEAVIAAMVGASGQDALEMAGGMTKLLHGDLMGGIKDLAPRVVRDPIKAYNLATKGVTDGKGQTVLPPDKLSGGDIALQAAGFQPSRVSEFRAGRNAVLEAKQETGTERHKLIARMITSAGGDRVAVLHSVQDFNKANPGQAITHAQILQAQQRMHKDAQALKQQPGSFGLHLNPKAAPGLQKAGSFATAR